MKAVISLNEAELDWSALTSAGIKHLSVPVPDYRPPTLEQMQAIVDFITSSLEPKDPVVVHCNAGMGRTGTVLACLLVWRDKVTAAEAVKKVRELRKGSVQTFKQEDGVKAWAEALRN